MLKNETIPRIYGDVGDPVSDIINLLESLDSAYTSIINYEITIDRYYRDLQLSRRYREYPPFYSGAIPSLREGRQSLPAGFRLRLEGVKFRSAGFWEFVGKLNPLEVVRLAINDAHERRKDREYREDAESKRLDLENKLLESRLLSEKVSLLREMGAGDEEMAQLRTILVHEPIERLLAVQNTGLISTAEMRPRRIIDPRK